MANSWSTIKLIDLLQKSTTNFQFLFIFYDILLHSNLNFIVYAGFLIHIDLILILNVLYKKFYRMTNQFKIFFLIIRKKPPTLSI